MITKLHTNFNDHVQFTEQGLEFWYARDLQKLLGYDEWRNFEKVIDKAKFACQSVGLSTSDHFVDVNKMVLTGSDAQREVGDMMLTRHACYLIAQNGDSKKEQIAFAMAYFAIQTRKQELIEKRIDELERIHFREKLTHTEKELSGILYERGIDDKGFARIRSSGDKALFGGKTTLDMKEKLNISPKSPLADFLPTITIKAKDFAAEITNFTLKKETRIKDEKTITREHIDNNKRTRDILVDKGIYVEDLPKEEDVKKVKRRVKKESVHLLKSKSHRLKNK